MRRFILIAVAFLAFGPGAFADHAVPVQKITGADQTALGELVELGVTPIDPAPADLAAVHYVWKVFNPDWTEKRFTQGRDDSTVIFGSGVTATRLKAFVAVTYVYIGKDDKGQTAVDTQTRILDANVVIGGGGVTPCPPDPAPAPAPAPAPVTPVAPVFPPGQFGLAQFAYQTAIAKVSSPARTKNAATLAASFRTISARALANQYKTDEELLQATAAANKLVLGAAQADWADFATALQDQLFNLYDTGGKLNAPTDYATAFNEIATGLEAAAK